MTEEAGGRRQEAGGRRGRTMMMVEANTERRKNDGRDPVEQTGARDHSMTG